MDNLHLTGREAEGRLVSLNSKSLGLPDGFVINSVFFGGRFFKGRHGGITKLRNMSLEADKTLKYQVAPWTPPV